jgi:hypothetical protein
MISKSKFPPRFCQQEKLRFGSIDVERLNENKGKTEELEPLKLNIVASNHEMVIFYRK